LPAETAACAWPSATASIAMRMLVPLLARNAADGFSLLRTILSVCTTRQDIFQGLIFIQVRINPAFIADQDKADILVFFVNDVEARNDDLRSVIPAHGVHGNSDRVQAR
jgi:hypothetical protein